MRRSIARSLALLMIAVLPVQAALAAGGALCGGPERALPAAALDAAAGHGERQHTHPGGDAEKHAHHGFDGPTGEAVEDHGAPGPHAHSTCSACAPCSGSMAAPAVDGVRLSSPRAGDDAFPPIVVAIRPVVPDGLERPPRTI